MLHKTKGPLRKLVHREHHFSKLLVTAFSKCKHQGCTVVYRLVLISLNNRTQFAVIVYSAQIESVTVDTAAECCEIT